MPHHPIHRTNTIDVNGYTLHVVVYDDGFGVLTVSDQATGEWHGIFVHTREQGETLFQLVREHLETTCERLSPTELLEQLPH